MSFSLKNTARTNIFNLKPYSSARDEFKGEAKVYLDANENPYPNGYNRYPDPMQWEVKNELAKIKNIAADHIILGNGSDEIIDLLIRTFCEPNLDEIIILPPTYGMYEVYGNINQVKIKAINLTENFQISLSEVKKAITPNSKIIFLCSPNNPSGNLLKSNDIKEILNNFDGLVVIDEAYIDFSTQESWTEYLDIYPNLFIMQTLSKAWGLAGIRLGMGFSNKEIINLLNKVKPPYNISQLTQEKALEVLVNDAKSNEKKNKVAQILKQRDVLINELLGIEKVQHIYPSDSNFVLIKIENATQVYEHLIQQSIVVRNRSNVTLCLDCLRITIGTVEENKILIDALKAI